MFDLLVGTRRAASSSQAMGSASDDAARRVPTLLFLPHAKGCFGKVSEVKYTKKANYYGDLQKKY